MANTFAKSCSNIMLLCVVPLLQLAESMKNDSATKAKFQTALTNIANRSLRAYPPNVAEDGIQIKTSYKRKATALNESDYQEAFQQKPKTRETRKVPCVLAPSLEKPGKKQKVASSQILTTLVTHAPWSPLTLHGNPLNAVRVECLSIEQVFLPSVQCLHPLCE